MRLMVTPFANCGWILLAVILTLPLGSLSQSNQTTFVPVAPEDLSSTFVRCIYKDSRGFMWFGTATGLIRYDGTTTYRYEHTRGSRNAITDNRINTIMEDSKKNLWIGTAQGLVYYNRETDDFTDIDSIPGNKNHLNNRYITSLCEDAQGRMWIGTLGQGVNVYDPEKHTFFHLGNAVQSNSLPSDYVTSLFLVDNTIWAGTKGGLIRFHTTDMRRMPLPVVDPSLATKEITQVRADVARNVWVTTVDREIIQLAAEGERYLVHKTLLQPEDLSEGEGSILTVAIDAANNVWLAGENSGLIHIEARSGRIVRHAAEEGSARKLPTNSIRSVYVDDTGIVWVGTYNRGAYIIDKNAKKFDSYQRSEFLKAEMHAQNVKGIAEDREGNIWVASDGGGLGMIDHRTKELQSVPDINKKLGTRYLSALFIDKSDNLWIGTWGKGLYKVELKSRMVDHYRIAASGFGDNKVFCIYEDNKNRIWVGSAGSGLFYLDPQSRLFKGMNERVRPNYIRKSAYVSDIFEDEDHSLWVTTLFGLYHLYDRGEDVYDVTLHIKSDQLDSIGSFDIITIHQDSKKNLWFGTGDYGLALRPYGQSVFRHIRKQDGLISNAVRGILTDTKENLWVSTNAGLTKYSPSANTFRHYTKEDGFPSNEFNANACLIARDGKFYFGTDRGLVAFYPDSIQNHPPQPVVYLTDLKLNNQSVRIGAEGSPLKKHISLSTEIELPYNQRSFAIDFVAMNPGQSSRIQYCYQLQGFDEDWNCVGPATSATYTNIDPGQYVFLVKATNSDGLSSVAPARLHITIHQTPWKTWWAYLIYALFLTSVTYFLFRIRIERIKIRSQLELERLAREKEHALSESKTQFFTDISHEFRTPLSLITMPLESLLSMNELPTGVRDRLATIRTSSDKMMRLVNELMDFNKLESAKLKLRVQHGELIQFIGTAAGVFEDVASRRGIHFGVHAMARSLEGWFDHDKLEKIVFNLLSNAFKFTADNGQINVIIQSRDVASRSLELVIIDNGIGIPPEELPYIFDKFYQARSSERIANAGTGIGLSLTKGLVELHHGTIQVESTPSYETRFVIQIPIDRDAYKDDEICEVAGYVRNGMDAVHENIIVSAPPSRVGHDDDRPLILVVEDNDELRKYVSMELEQQFAVVEAKDGNEGLHLAFERSPDLIISDILMPLKNGIEFCREVKSDLKTSHIPFILLTAKAMVDDQISGIATGADLYITKPFSIRFLVAHVKQIIESREKLYSRFSQDVYLLPGKVAGNELDKAFLQKAIDYIITHIQEPQLGVDSIADLFNLSRMQVYRKIKALTGKSVVEFIRMVRVKQALKLMDTHKYTLSEVAYQTGFNSSSYFTRVFKEEYGKAPSEYLQS